MKPELLLLPEVAAMLRVPEKSLRHWRAQNKGPKSIRLGQRVMYDHADVVAWLDAQSGRTAKGGVK